MSEDYVSFSKSGCRKLAYAVLCSGLKSRDKLFFESGVYRFYLDFLDFSSLRSLSASIKEMAAALNWKLPPYPMNVKNSRSVNLELKAEEPEKAKKTANKKGGSR